MMPSTASRHLGWAAGCEADPLSQPIRKSYPWRNTSGPIFASSWSASQPLSSDVMARLGAGNPTDPHPEGKVHGGLPRVVSLPQLEQPESINASPEERCRPTSLADSASAPAVPPASLAASRPAGGAEAAAPLEHSSSSSGGRPASAPPASAHQQQQPGRSFRAPTAPVPSPPDWPATSEPGRPPASRAEALGIPQLSRRSSYGRLQRAVGGSGDLIGGKGHGSCCALDALGGGSSVDSVSNSKQHGSFTALSILASQGSGEASLPPSGGGGSGLFGRRLRRGKSAELGAFSAWGPRLAESLHLGGSGGGGGSGKQQRKGGLDGQHSAPQPLATRGGGGGEFPTSEDDDQLSDGGARLSAGAFDEQLTPHAGAGHERFRPFGGGVPPRPPGSPPAGHPPALRVAVARPQSPSPGSVGQMCSGQMGSGQMGGGQMGDGQSSEPGYGHFFSADAPAAAGGYAAAFSAPDAGRLPPSSLPPLAGGGGGGGGGSRRASAELAPLERHQRGSCAALAALGGSAPSSPAALGPQTAGRPQSPSPLSPQRSLTQLQPPSSHQHQQQRPWQQSPRDHTQPPVLRSPKRGGSGRLGSGGLVGPLHAATSPGELSSSTFGLLSAAACQLQGGGASSPPSQGLGVSSSESLAGLRRAGGSGSSSNSGSSEWSGRFGSLSADSVRGAATEQERTMKAGMRRGSSGTLPGAAALGGLLPASTSGDSLPVSPTTLSPQQLQRHHSSSDISPQGKAGSPAQHVPPPAAPWVAPVAAAMAATQAHQQQQQQQQQPQEQRAGYGSLVAKALTTTPFVANAQRGGSLGSWAAGGASQQPHQGIILQGAANDTDVQASFGSVFLLEEPASVVAEAAKAAVAARVMPAQQAAPAGHAVPRHDRSGGAGHAHSVPAVTAVKVVPRIGDADDTGPLRPRFTSLPTHLDAITER